MKGAAHKLKPKSYSTLIQPLNGDTTTPRLPLGSGHPLVPLYQLFTQYSTHKSSRYTDLSVPELFQSIFISIPVWINSTDTYETFDFDSWHHCTDLETRYHAIPIQIAHLLSLCLSSFLFYYCHYCFSFRVLYLDILVPYNCLQEHFAYFSFLFRLNR